MSVSSIQPIVENSDKANVEGRSEKKIALSPIVKGIIAGVISALVIGIFFGPMAAVIAFCLSFGSAYFSSHNYSNISAEQAPAPTQEKVEGDWDRFQADFERGQKEFDALAERIRENRKFLDLRLRNSKPQR